MWRGGQWPPVAHVLASLRGNVGQTATTEPDAPSTPGSTGIVIDLSKMNDLIVNSDRGQSDQAALHFRGGPAV
jgi:hypothetical protein